MMTPRVVASALLLLWACEAAAQPAARVVARPREEERFKTDPVQARVGDAVELTVMLQEGRRLQPLPDGASVQWIQVVPRMQHRDPPARNNGNQIYSNSIMFGPNHGRWLGHDTLEYDDAPLKTRAGALIKGSRLWLSKAHATRFGGLGTIWIAAEVTLPAKEGKARRSIRTPDSSSVNPLGLSTKAMRVSFRDDDTFVGWLGTFFNVPYVFGSTGQQTDRYTGTDCADAMVGALRAAGKRRVPYTSVMGLAKLARSLSPILRLDEHGTVRAENGAEVSLRWGEHVRPGDLLAMDFTSPTAVSMLPRAWDHVAALVHDGAPGTPGAGVLDGSDLVRHMTIYGLADEPLESMGQIRFRLWRWRR